MIDACVDVERCQAFVDMIGPSFTPMGQQLGAIPIPHLSAELGRSIGADPDLTHRQHDMRVRSCQPVGSYVPMDIELGDHAALDELGLDARSEEHTSELLTLMRISYAVLCL